MLEVNDTKIKVYWQNSLSLLDFQYIPTVGLFEENHQSVLGT
jgi:hypothetical protein